MAASLRQSLELAEARSGREKIWVSNVLSWQEKMIPSQYRFRTWYLEQFVQLKFFLIFFHHFCLLQLDLKVLEVFLSNFCKGHSAGNRGQSEGENFSLLGLRTLVGEERRGVGKTSRSLQTSGERVDLRESIQRQSSAKGVHKPEDHAIVKPWWYTGPKRSSQVTRPSAGSKQEAGC